MSNDELRNVTFFRENALKIPIYEDLPMMEDADEHKLTALNKLLWHMYRLHSELKQIGIHLRPDKYHASKEENIYQLTDSEYEDWPYFKILLRSSWFRPDYTWALHVGFEFHLYVIHDGYQGRSEIADWISITVKHHNTTPFSLGARREHVKSLGFFLKNPGDSYFHDMPMEHTTHVSFNRLHDGLSFKTALFNQSADDACTVINKLISRKQFLKALPLKP